MSFLSFDQSTDLGLGDGRNVMESRLGRILDPGTFDHAPVADESNPLAAKHIGDFFHLGLEGQQIGRVARKDLRRDRIAVPVAQQPGDDLFLAPLFLSRL